MLTFGARLALRVQRTLGLALFPLLGSLIVMILRLRGLRVEDMAAVRQRFSAIVDEFRGPLLICGNHITRVDSVLIDWALASNWNYFLRFDLLPWNLPERQNYYHNVLLRIVCYLCKCVPIVRDGTVAEKKASLRRLAYLLQRGEAISIFPEGTRTHTGALDMENYGYGIGQLASEVSGSTILCVYLRGHQQRGRTTMPPKGDTLHVELQVLRPETSHTGRRAARDISVQTMALLSEMEERYFDRHPSMRPCAEDASDARQGGA